MSRHLKHQTRVGERFDTLAYRYYGDANRTAPIIAANRDVFLPEMPVPATLPDGLMLRVPVLDDASAEDDLPPWKRGRTPAAG